MSCAADGQAGRAWQLLTAALLQPSLHSPDLTANPHPTSHQTLASPLLPAPSHYCRNTEQSMADRAHIQSNDIPHIQKPSWQDKGNLTQTNGKPQTPRSHRSTQSTNTEPAHSLSQQGHATEKSKPFFTLCSFIHYRLKKEASFVCEAVLIFL